MLSRLGAGLALSAALLLAGCEFSKGHSAGSGDSSLPTTPAAPVGFLAGLSLSAGGTGVVNIVTALPRFGGAAADAVTQSSDIDASRNTRTAVGLTFLAGNVSHQFVYFGDGAGTPDDTLLGNTAPVTVSGRVYNQYILGADSGVPLDTDGGGDDGRAYVRAFTDRGIGGADGTNYLAGAVWLFVPDDPSADDYILGAAANGTDSFNGANVAGLTGSATYAGAAAGLALVNGSPREFQGAVALTASFLGTGSVSGGMGGFTGADGNAFAGAVSLSAAALTAGSNSFSGALSGSGGIFNGASGNWGGRFFNDTSGNAGAHPLGIAGTAAGGRVVGGAPNFFAIGFQSTRATTAGAGATGFLADIDLTGETEFANLTVSRPRFSTGALISHSSNIGAAPGYQTGDRTVIQLGFSNRISWEYDANGDGSYEHRLSLPDSVGGAAATVSIGGSPYNQILFDGAPLDIDTAGTGGSADGRVYARVIDNLGIVSRDAFAMGVWLYAPDDPASGSYFLGSGYQGVQTHASSFTAANVQGLTGGATYAGAAIGLAVDGGSPLSFQGAVTLAADFLGTGSVSGSMGGFTDGAGNALAGQVILGTAALTSGSATFGGSVSGSGGKFANIAGNWGGQFLIDGGTADDHPGTIGGTAAGGGSGFYFASAFHAAQSASSGSGGGLISDLLLTGEAEIANLAAATLNFESGGGAVSQSSNGSIDARLDVALSGSAPEFTALLDTAAASGFETTVTTSGLGSSELSRADITLNGLTLQAAEVGERSGLGISWDADAADEGKLYARLFTNRGSSGVSDTNYLAAGVWLFVPDDASADDYAMGAMADGADPFDPANVTGLTGTATYSGSAIGVFSGSGGAGSFEAEMDITADFGTATANGTISGTMSNFTDSGGSLAGTLTLGQAALTANSNTFSGAVSGAGGVFAGASGNWGGRLFNDGSSATDHPGAVAGTVSGGVAADNFYFAGAYIAEKD